MPSRGKRATTSGRVARFAGFCAGCVLAVALLVAARVPAPDARLGAHASVASARAGELIPIPARTIVTGDLLPGSGNALRGSVSLRNPTEVTLLARPRATGAATPLDADVRLAFESHGRRLFEGSLSALRSSARSVAIRAGKRARIRVRVWLAPRSRGFAGRLVEVRLEWLTRIRGS